MDLSLDEHLPCQDFRAPAFKVHSCPSLGESTRAAVLSSARWFPGFHLTDQEARGVRQHAEGTGGRPVMVVWNVITSLHG